MNNTQKTACDFPLRELAEAFAPSGFEGEAVSIAKNYIKKYTDDCSITRDGSLIAAIHPHGAANGEKSLMIQAHIDEVGFMIKSVDKDGTLRFAPIGMSDIRLLVGRRVILSGAQGVRYPGYIGVRPVHLSSKCTSPGMNDLYIDIGAAHSEEALAAVPLGSFGTFMSEFELYGLSSSQAKGKALSSRACCAAICRLIRELSENTTTDFDVYFALTCRGVTPVSAASGAAVRCAPKRVLSLTGSCDGSRGEGVIIPALCGNVPLDRKAFEDLNSLAQAHGIKHKTAASCECRDALSTLRGGFASAILALPCDGMGSSSESVSISDILSMYDMLLAYIRETKL